MKKKEGLVVLLSAFVTLTLVLATTTVCLSEVKELKIGAVYPMSGFLAKHGKDAVTGHNLAIEKINAAGGIKSLGGAKVKLVVGDTETKDENAIAQTERMCNIEKVPLILGSYGSSATFPATMIAEKYKTPMIVTYSVADKITGRGFKNVFRICFKASSNAEDNYRFLEWLGETTDIKAKKVGLLYGDTLWGQSSAKAWKQLAPKYGLKVVADVSFPLGSKDVTAQILKLKAAAPDVVLKLAYVNDGILLTRSERDLGYKPKMGMIVAGHNQTEYYDATKGLSENRFVNAIWHNTLKIPKIKELNDIIQARFNRPINDTEAMSYMSALVALDALERAGSLDKAKIRNALTQTRMAPGTAGSVLHYTIEFDETGQVKNAPTCFAQVTNNQPIAVYPPEYAATKPTWPAFK